MAANPLVGATAGGMEGQAWLARGGDGHCEDGEGPAQPHHSLTGGYPQDQCHLQHQHLQVSPQ